VIFTEGESHDLTVTVDVARLQDEADLGAVAPLT
jgi:hypothetical protein